MYNYKLNKEISGFSLPQEMVISFSYTTPKRHFQYGFYSRTVFGGANTDAKFWVGGYINIPIGGK